MKKIISLFLILIFCLSLTTSVFATENEITINEIIENNFVIEAPTPEELKNKTFTINDDFTIIWDTMTKYKLTETKIYIYTETEKEFLNIADNIITNDFKKYFHQKYPYYAMEFEGICKYYSYHIIPNGTNYLEIKLIYNQEKTKEKIIKDYENTLKFCKNTVLNWYNTALNINSSNEEKMKYAYNWMINNTSYDYTLEKSHPSDIIKTQKGICQNLTAIYNLLLKYMGIDTMCVTGTYKGEGHAWTEILTENENRYIDVTWGETYSLKNKIEYKWFLTTRKYLETCKDKRKFD